jgi:tetratricopeptide (TPR) repeat protein
VTLGDIAHLRAQRGELDAALALHQEALATCEALGHPEGKANSLWSIAQIEIQQGKHQEGFQHLAESYAIYLKLGRLDGICVVGLDLGWLLCAAGQREKGLDILARSRDGFRKLGRQRQAEAAEKLIQSLSAPKP